MEITGAVLAGGLSKRFGRDKARFLWRGKPLLAHVLDSLAPAAERFVVANRDYSEFGVPVYHDVISGGDSLSGIHSALHHAKNEWVAVAACDLPRLSADYWRFMLAQAGKNDHAVVALGPSGWIEPLAALYRKTLEPLAAMQLKNEDFYLRRFVDLAEAKLVPWEELSARFGDELFLNANRLEDLPVSGGE